MGVKGVRPRLAAAVVAAGALAVLIGAAAVVVRPTCAAGPDAALAAPLANNGTVKIDGVDINSGQPDNNPHQGCTFVVEFYNYEEGDLNAVVRFADQPPTANGGLQV